jgi:hypothetical protein
MATDLTEIDSLEVQVIVDNELDPISKYIEPVIAYGNLAHIGLAGPKISDHRGNDIHEVRMDQICCGAHGLSLLIVCSSHLRKMLLQSLREWCRLQLVEMKSEAFCLTLARKKITGIRMQLVCALK